jgi:ATP-binding cassette, subfamily B, bacterial
MEQKKTISKQAVRQVLRDYWNQYKQHPWLTAIGWLFPAIGTILVFFVPPLILARIVNLFAAQEHVTISMISRYLLLLAGLWLLGEILWRIGTHALIRVQISGIRSLNRKAFQRLSDKEYGFYANNFVGALTKRAMSYVSGFESLSDIFQYSIFSNGFTLIFATVVLWQYSPIIPLVLLGFVALTLMISIPLIRRRSSLVIARHEANSMMTGRLSDAMTNIAAVKSFAHESHETDVYGTHVEDYIRKYKKAADFNNLKIFGALSPLYVATNVVGLMLAAYFTITLGLAAGTLIVVFTFYAQISRIFWEINYTYRNIETAVSGAAEFTQMFIDPPTIADAPDAKALVVENGAIRFNDISFGYGKKSDKKSFLQNFSLSIEAGQRIGLVGPSGGGKTTITKLILRFIDIHEGTISIDGQAIKNVTQQSLRAAIAYVPQEPLLFHRSLLENIAYGNIDATLEEVKEAARLAHADEFIEILPDKYDTLVGERGIKLSGGQRQRIAIARAMLKKSKILVLDEATSALDSESEKYIQEGLWELMKGKTAVVIAHRLSTIRHLDRIIVMDKGMIVQDGTHDELIAQAEGLYAKLWSHQSGGFLEE